MARCSGFGMAGLQYTDLGVTRVATVPHSRTAPSPARA
jgi:hypothetical protein